MAGRSSPPNSGLAKPHEADADTKKPGFHRRLNPRCPDARTYGCFARGPVLCCQNAASARCRALALSLPSLPFVYRKRRPARLAPHRRNRRDSVAAASGL